MFFLLSGDIRMRCGKDKGNSRSDLDCNLHNSFCAYALLVPPVKSSLSIPVPKGKLFYTSADISPNYLFPCLPPIHKHGGFLEITLL